MDNREAFTQKLNAKLEEYKAEFDKLKAQTKGAYAQGQIEGSEEGKTIKAKIEKAKLRLKEFEDSKEEKWEVLKDDMERIWDDLRNSLKKLKN